MIENQLTAVPAGNARQDGRENGQKHAMRQDSIRIDKTQAPIGTSDRDQRHSRNGMGPARRTGANAGNEQQFRRADNTGSNTCQEGDTRRPEPGTQPERIGAEPVEYIGSQRSEHQGDWEMHAHGMQRVTGNGDRGGFILLLQLLNDGIGIIGLRCFGHGNPPFGDKRPSRRELFRRPAVISLAALPLASCSGDLSALDPAGPYAGAIANLWWIMLAGAAVILSLVLVLFGLVFFRPGFGRSLSPKGWMIAGGLFLPVPVLFSLMAYGMAQGEYLIGAWQREPVVARVEAHAAMWRWDFRYPDMGAEIETAETLHIPVGGVVEVTVTSADVVHSFWIPRLAGKIDAVPGHVTTLRIKADTPGRYGGICAEYCGTGHTAMRFTVEAHSPEDYQKRLTALSAGVPAP